MKAYPRDFSKRLRNQLANGIAFDAALGNLRSEGASIMECIKATKNALGRNLEDAKRLVYDSKTWADVAKQTDAIWAEYKDESPENSRSDAI